MPKVEVTVINSNLGLRRTTTTDDMGRFLVNGLLPGWYEVRVTKAGFEVSRQDVELRIGQTVAFNVSLNQSAYTVDPGEIPVGTPASAGVSTAAGSTSTAAGFSGDVPVVPPSPNQPSATFEFITKNFDNDIELVSWLTTKKNEKKLLVRIFPIRDKTSLFMFQPIKGTTGYQFTASLVNEMLDENKLMTRINQNKGRTFIGVYLLSPQSYWMVFYGK